MFINEKQKNGKMNVLKNLASKLSEVDSAKFKKPVAAEVSVTEVKPASGLEAEMAKVGHEGVEEAEENLFPAEEAKEDEMMEGSVDEETKMMIKKLYEKFFGGVA